MPNKTLIFNVLGIILQYSLLFFIYYFLFKVIKVIIKDLSPVGQGIAIRRKHSQSSNKQQGVLVVVEKEQVKLKKDQFILSDTVSIGRNEHNEVCVDDAFVSYEHAMIHKNRQGYWLTDLNSTNKTYLNNQPMITETLLKNGDLIKIGAVTFRFEG